jgi:biotin carboxyl carrier protein
MATATERLRSRVKEEREALLDGNPADVLRQLYSSEEYRRYREDKEGNYKLSNDFKKKEKIALEALYDIKKREWDKIEELKKKVEEEESRFVKEWGAFGYLGENVGFLNDIGGKVRDYIEGRSDENPLKDYYVVIEEVDENNPDVVATVNRTQEKQEEQKEQKQELTQQPQPQIEAKAQEKTEEKKEKNKEYEYKVIATRKGVVSEVGDDYVKIRYKGAGGIEEFTYSGLKGINVKKGDKIKEGQVIGQSDKEINIDKKVVVAGKQHHTNHNSNHKVYQAKGNTEGKGTLDGEIKTFLKNTTSEIDKAIKGDKLTRNPDDLKRLEGVIERFKLQLAKNPEVLSKLAQDKDFKDFLNKTNELEKHITNRGRKDQKNIKNATTDDIIKRYNDLTILLAGMNGSNKEDMTKNVGYQMIKQYNIKDAQKNQNQTQTFVASSSNGQKANIQKTTYNQTINQQSQVSPLGKYGLSAYDIRKINAEIEGILAKNVLPYNYRQLEILRDNINNLRSALVSNPQAFKELSTDKDFRRLMENTQKLDEKIKNDLTTMKSKNTGIIGQATPINPFISLTEAIKRTKEIQELISDYNNLSSKIKENSKQINIVRNSKGLTTKQEEQQHHYKIAQGM